MAVAQDQLSKVKSVIK